MANDPKNKVAAEEPAKRTPNDRGAAGAADEPPARRLVPPPRTLIRTELEALRSRLKGKFH